MTGAPLMPRCKRASVKKYGSPLKGCENELAIVAARTMIVDGAVGMVEMALEHLNRDGIVDLDSTQRAALVSNLLVVLCSDRHAQPVVQAGSSHSAG